MNKIMKDKHDIIKNALDSDSCPNIILYGNKGSDKLKLLLSIIKCTNFKLITQDKISWESNNIYNIFDMKNINKEYKTFFDIINILINHKNYYNIKSFKFIILKNFNLVNSIVQNKLRVIIEKYYITTRFIFLTENISSIIDPIKSRSLMIRIPLLINSEKRNISRLYIKDLPYEKKSIIYDKIYTIDNEKCIKLFSEYNDNLFMNYKTVYEIIYNNLDKISNKDKIKKTDIDKIKEISYNIEKYNLYDIHSELCKLYIKDYKYTNKIKRKIIKILSDLEYDYKKGYRKLIYIESLLIELLYLSRGEI